MKKEPSGNKYLVPALSRGMKLLELLAEHPQGLSMPEMESLGFPPASLYRMLITLLELNYISRDGNDVYRLSRRLLSLAYRAMDESGLAEKSISSMRRLRDATGETVLLAVIYGREGVVIEEVPSDRAVKVTVRVGHHFPLHTAAPAKAIMAWLPEEEQKHLLDSIVYTRFNRQTVTGAAALARELALIRKSGFACDRGEELEEIRCVAAPVFDHRHYPVASIWISGPASRLNEQAMTACAKPVIEAAAEISNRIS